VRKNEDPNAHENKKWAPVPVGIKLMEKQTKRKTKAEPYNQNGGDGYCSSGGNAKVTIDEVGLEANAGSVDRGGGVRVIPAARIGGGPTKKTSGGSERGKVVNWQVNPNNG